TAKCPTEPERTSPQRRRSVRPSRSGLRPSDGEVSDRAGADFAPATAKCPTEPERTSPQRRRSVRRAGADFSPATAKCPTEPERSEALGLSGAAALERFGAHDEDRPRPSHGPGRSLSKRRRSLSGALGERCPKQPDERPGVWPRYETGIRPGEWSPRVSCAIL